MFSHHQPPDNHFVNRVMMERDSFNINTKMSDDTRYSSRKVDLPAIFGVQQGTGGMTHHSEVQSEMSRHLDIRPMHGGMPNNIPQPNLSNISNIFTLDFLKQITSSVNKQKSIILSPYSMIQLFIMLYVSSNGQSEIELQKYFSFGTKSNMFLEMQKLNDTLSQTNVFRNTSLICVSNKYKLNDNHVKSLMKLGYVVSYNDSQTESEANKLNQLSTKVSDGLITNVVTSEMLQPPTVMFLLNIIYFYSKWKSPFSPSETSSELFFGSSQRQVQMMKQTDIQTNYYEDVLFQLLEMDYDDGSFSMGFLLPKNKGQPIMDNSQLNTYIGKLSNTKISILQIPKFKQEFKYKVDNIFRKQGMTQVFDDLDISSLIQPVSEPIAISYIIHGAVIIVDETGTKAAAYTGMVVSWNSTSNKISFVANRPFLYYIRHKPTNLITFVGQYY